MRLKRLTLLCGGSAPSLDRTDTIDGGSAQDTINVAMDGNFLLGFSSHDEGCGDC